MRYLNRIKHWGLYDLDFFGATLVLFDSKQLVSLVAGMLLDMPKTESHRTRDQYLWAILTNSIALLIHRREFSESVRLLTIATSMPVPLDDFYSRLMLRYRQRLSNC